MTETKPDRRSPQQKRTDAYMVSPEFRAICERLFTDKDASIKDALTFIRVELEDALNNIPPAGDDGTPIDTWHAGCAVLRAYATLFKVNRCVEELHGIIRGLKDTLDGRVQSLESIDAELKGSAR